LIIWSVAVLAVLAWPPQSGRSLGVKLASWAADPRGSLPEPPPSLPMGMDDDGDAVAEHDMLETAYLQARERSTVTRWRMDVKQASDPFDSSTQRQVVAAVIVLAALSVWRMDRPHQR
jgi:hypothetical protein